jgi:methionyl-tRNA formyltransferase
MFVLVIGNSFWFTLVTKVLRHYFNNKKIFIIDRNVNINLEKILKKNKIIYLFNFYSSDIIKENLLEKIKYPINFHAGNTRYPGRGGYCHAIYNSEKTYGSVAHLMEKRVDTGKIIKELNFNISSNETVESLKFRTFLISFYLFYDIILQIFNKNLNFEKKKWKRKPYKLSDLNKIKLVKKNFSKKKINKIKRSTTYYPYGPFFLIGSEIKKMKIKFKKKLI